MKEKYIWIIRMNVFFSKKEKKKSKVYFKHDWRKKFEKRIIVNSEERKQTTHLELILKYIFNHNNNRKQLLLKMFFFLNFPSIYRYFKNCLNKEYTSLSPSIYIYVVKHFLSLEFTFFFHFFITLFVFSGEILWLCN